MLKAQPHGLHGLRPFRSRRLLLWRCQPQRQDPAIGPHLQRCLHRRVQLLPPDPRFRMGLRLASLLVVSRGLRRQSHHGLGCDFLEWHHEDTVLGVNVDALTGGEILDVAARLEVQHDAVASFYNLKG
jgi:hypothetical protein